MKRVKRSIRRMLLINKKFFRQPSFVAMFLLIPIFVLVVFLSATFDSSVLKISIYPGSDERAKEVINKLIEKDSIVGYKICGSEKEATDAVERGNSDAAWVFGDDFSEILSGYSDGITGKTLVVSYQREENPTLMLSTLKLYTCIGPELFHETYIKSVSDVLDDNSITEADIEDAYERYIVNGTLFDMRHAGDKKTVSGSENYMTSPLRGMLAIWIFMMGIAAEMCFMKDEEAGLFERRPVNRRYIIELMYVLVAKANAAVVSLFMLMSTDLNVGFFREIIIMAVYLPASSALCILLGRILKQQERLGAALPIIIICMLVACPVFINVKKLFFLRLLFPATYFLLAAHATVFIPCLAAYGLVLWVIVRLFRR